MKMTKKMKIISVVAALSLFLIVFCAAKFVFLSPSCFSNNKNLTDRENYFLKKLTLEAVEDRLSVFSDAESENRSSRSHLFILINHNFMDSAQKKDDGYIVRVQTYGMEEFSSDCTYEIYFSKDFTITLFTLDP